MCASNQTLYPAKTLLGENFTPNDIMKTYKELMSETYSVL